MDDNIVINALYNQPDFDDLLFLAMLDVPFQTLENQCKEIGDSALSICESREFWQEKIKKDFGDVLIPDVNQPADYIGIYNQYKKISEYRAGFIASLKSYSINNNSIFEYNTNFAMAPFNVEFIDTYRLPVTIRKFTVGKDKNEYALVADVKIRNINLYPDGYLGVKMISERKPSYDDFAVDPDNIGDLNYVISVRKDIEIPDISDIFTQTKDYINYFVDEDDAVAYLNAYINTSYAYIPVLFHPDEAKINQITSRKQTYIKIEPAE